MKHALLTLVLLLGACASSIDAPSLGIRAAENEDIDAPAAAAVPPVPADATQQALIDRLLALARRGDAGFDRALPNASVNAPPQSEAWILAQNARSAVEIARGPTLDALSGLDAAIGDAIDRGQDTAALAAARAEVQSMYDRQATRLDALIR